MTIHQSITDEGVLELVMDNPKVNALPIADTHAIAEILDGVKHRPEITAVVLTATGRGKMRNRRIPHILTAPRTGPISSRMRKASSSTNSRCVVGRTSPRGSARSHWFAGQRTGPAAT